MELNKGANTVASIPTPDSGGTAGWFRNQGNGPPWTTIKADALNGVFAELKNLIEAAGLTLDGADLTQILQAVGGAIGMKSALTTTGSATTIHTRAVMASETCTASGSRSAAVASATCTISGAKAAAIASATSTASGTGAVAISSVGSTASGDKSAVIASDASTASGAVSAVIASTGSYASGAGSVVIGGDNVEIGSTNTVGGGDNSGSGAITPSGSNQGLTWYVTGPGNVGCNNILVNGIPSMPNMPVYADEAAAVTGGIATGTVYRTATGELRIKL